MNTRGSASTIAATVYRGPAVENTHRAHIAVVDAAGRLVYAFDDPYRPTLPCSAVKPVQALAVVETGALERFGFDDADLALMCASHNSEEMHLERARAMLAKARLSEADLRCGGHPPISEEVERTWIKRDFTPTPICSNCSGKHVGMLAAARAMGADTLGYEHDAHPLQQRVKSTLAQLTALREDEIQWGTDGCNLPTPSFALDRLARIFAKLAEAGASGAELAGSADPAQAPTRHAALARIYRAMTTHSDLVAGKGRFCTALMNAFDATVVGKIGAEASYGLGIRADAHRVDGVTGALGIAVKIEDGASGILTAVVVELLHQLEIGTAAQRARLDAYRAPPVKNTVGIEVGRVELSIALQRLAGLAGSLISLARTNSHALGVDALEWLFSFALAMSRHWARQCRHALDHPQARVPARFLAWARLLFRGPCIRRAGAGRHDCVAALRCGSLDCLDRRSSYAAVSHLQDDAGSVRYIGRVASAR